MWQCPSLLCKTVDITGRIPLRRNFLQLEQRFLRTQTSFRTKMAAAPAACVTTSRLQIKRLYRWKCTTSTFLTLPLNVHSFFLLHVHCIYTHLLLFPCVFVKKQNNNTGCLNSREEVLSQFEILHYTCIYSCETVLIFCPWVRALLQYILFIDFVILLWPIFNLPL